jgi:adenosylcobyric acid synthase
VYGSYLHGLFASDAFRGAFLARLGIEASGQRYRGKVESALDALADHIEAHLDVEGLLALAR